MDLFTIIGACVRRWYVTVPIIALAMFGAYNAYKSVPSSYSSTTSIAILPAAPNPQATATPKAGTNAVTPENPYAGSGGPRFAAVVLARNINTGTYRQQIGLGKANDVTYTATASTTQPIINISATGPSGAAVLDALTRVTGQAGVVLNQFQTAAGAPQQTLYRIAVAVPADTVTDVTPSRWRNAGALIALGLALAAGLATALDVALRRRRPSHGSKAAKAAPTAPADDESTAREDGVADESPVVFPARRGPKAPAVEETDRELAMDEAGPEPAAEEPDREPVLDDADHEPLLEASDREPAMDESDREPVVEDVDREPAVEAATRG